MSATNRPTWRARRLGKELRDLREARGLHARAAAEHLECTQPRMSQIEAGTRALRPAELKSLLVDLYEVKDKDYVARLCQLLRDRSKKAWTTADGPMLHADLQDYLTIEEDAKRVRTYEHSAIPGLLQTEDYANLILGLSTPVASVAPLLAARMNRQKKLLEEGFELRVVIDLQALYRIPTAVAAGQLKHLKEQAQSTNVTVQVLPTNAQMPLDYCPPFTILSMTGTDAPEEETGNGSKEDFGAAAVAAATWSLDVVWLEHRTGASMLEGLNDLAAYEAAWAEMSAAALSPVDSQKCMQVAAKEITQ
ncbi:helix-turn-helix domain-containing protein [Streptomyces tubercidicus]|uniref:helix-turn-helix domain-containing protein n=1 Tax=Streptomyces tubercidicus TaxID=47759 RepID=UPI0036A7B946